jgi:hypothetical protein
VKEKDRIMNIKTLMAVALACAVLAGCAAGPKLGDIKQNLAALAPDKGRIYFFEGDRQGGALVNPSVHFDGRAVGVCMPRSVFFIDVPPGQYRAHASNKTTHRATMREVDIVIPARAGEESYIRCRVRKGVAVGKSGAYIGNGELELVDPARGAAAIESLAFIGSVAQIEELE